MELREQLRSSVISETPDKHCCAELYEPFAASFRTEREDEVRTGNVKLMIRDCLGSLPSRM